MYVAVCTQHLCYVMHRWMGGWVDEFVHTFAMVLLIISTRVCMTTSVRSRWLAQLRGTARTCHALLPAGPACNSLEG